MWNEKIHTALATILLNSWGTIQTLAIALGNNI